LRRLRSDEGGATIVEHAILVCVVALVLVSMVGSGVKPSTVLRGMAYVGGTILAEDGQRSAITSDLPAAGK
jgi:Flp pilus assembly pilin Flp